MNIFPVRSKNLTQEKYKLGYSLHLHSPSKTFLILLATLEKYDHLEWSFTSSSYWKYSLFPTRCKVTFFLRESLFVNMSYECLPKYLTSSISITPCKYAYSSLDCSLLYAEKKDAIFLIHLGWHMAQLSILLKGK